ncbi:MAG TPA: hypothetical protein GX707_04825 [Epulopiscium sp.]|nr:hypothetical protein [Candidatus Epulonipiscium sp.]
MRRKIFILLTMILSMYSFGGPVFANEKVSAIANQQLMHYDGKLIFSRGFNVANNNYFSLRDFAKSLSGTPSQFDVTWNNKKGLIEIIIGKPYAGSEDGSVGYIKDKRYFGVMKNTTILLDGKECKLGIFNIDGENYFKLRDLEELAGFELMWNTDTQQILLFSKLPDHANRVNIDSNNSSTLYSGFTRWNSPMTSHILEEEDGIITSLEADGEIKINRYKDYQLMSSQTIAYELPEFGAFYKGKEYNYIAFGQHNTGEDDNKEVIRIVRYDSNFNRIDSVSVEGGESITTIPFNCGSGEMVEYGDKLVFHTSRQRYRTEDGLNHQSQLTLIVDTSAMKVINQIGKFQRNHVSHSLDQYVLSDDGEHVLLDQGDGFPRAIVLNKGDGDKYESVALFEIPGAIGANSTGVSVGGLEASQTNYLIAMNTIDHSLVSEYTSFEMVGLGEEQRDIMIATVPKDSLNNMAVKHIKLYQYIGKEESGSVPKLVKINENKLMVIWQEFNDMGYKTDVKYVYIDSSGNPTGDIQTLKNAQLSRVQPIVVDHQVAWYSDDRGVRTFWTIDLGD